MAGEGVSRLAVEYSQKMRIGCLGLRRKSTLQKAFCRHWPLYRNASGDDVHDDRGNREIAMIFSSEVLEMFGSFTSIHNWFGFLEKFTPEGKTAKEE